MLRGEAIPKVLATGSYLVRSPKAREPKLPNTTTPNDLPAADDAPFMRVTRQLAVAAIGAGVVTTIAVVQGQDPLVAFGITVFSAFVAVVLGNAL